MPQDASAIGQPPAAVILAAGLGRRLGGLPKAALEIEGASLLERLARALREAGIADIAVVLGPYQDILLPLARHCELQPLLHEQQETPLAESQRRAVLHHVAHSVGQDLLVLLADLPLLEAAHIGRLLDAWRSRPPGVHAQMPMVDGVRGHPVLLSWTAAEQVAATPAPLGIRDWLAGHRDLALPFLTTERAYVTDIDTAEDLAALRALYPPGAVAWPPSVPAGT